VIGYVEQPGGTVVRRFLQPQPDADVTFLYEVMTPDNKVALAPSGKTKWGQGLELIPMFQEPGPYVMVVAAESIGGFAAAQAIGYTQRSDPRIEDLEKRGGTYAARDLVGDWKVLVGRLAEGATDVEWVDTGATVHYRESEKYDNVLAYEFKSAADPAMPKGLVLVDTRGAPQLVYFVEGAGGRPVRSDLHIAFLLREEGRQVLVVKDLLRGGAYQFVRGGDGPPPPPKPPARLDGTWRSADGAFVLVLQGGRYQSTLQGQIIDAGSYRVEGDRIVSQRFDGVVENLRFTLAGDALTLVNGRGERLDLVRVR
jgi:hypothetical protein